MFRLILSASLLLCVASVTGCSSDSEAPPAEGDRIFAVEKGAQPDGAEILGVWESTAPLKNPPLSATTRFELRVDSFAMALRCSMDDGSAQPINVGGKAAATVSKDGITVKTAIQRTERIGANAACGVQFSAGVLPACDAKVAEEKRATCFSFEPGSFKIYQQAGAAPTALVKVAD